jgi:hypothetical protein
LIENRLTFTFKEVHTDGRVKSKALKKAQNTADPHRLGRSEIWRGEELVDLCDFLQA